MTKHSIVSPEQWVEARKTHLAKEKQLTRLRDELARERRELPWTRVEKNYTFDALQGKVSLADLFGHAATPRHKNERAVLPCNILTSASTRS